MKKLNLPKKVINRYSRLTVFFLLGILFGWLVFSPSHRTEEKHDHSTDIEQQSTVWTCAMHPQIRMDKPGKCPICGMDLIPLAESGILSIDPEAIHMTEGAARLADVLTTVVSRQKKPVKEVRLYGKVQPDERLLQSQVAHVSGRIEKLYVSFTGESVRKGQLLARIYSPELIIGQQELLEAAKTKSTQPVIYEATREKLRLLKLTNSQIENIENSGIVQTTLDIVSNTDGIVISREVSTGDYISQGATLFRIANLSKVWVLFDAYESDLQFINKNEKITFTLQSLPGTEYSGTITFIDPVIDPVTRVARIRVEVSNPSGRLKPEMFATGVLRATLKEYSNNIIIPESSVLWTGKRSIVYVKQPGVDEPVFKMREIVLGPYLGDSFVVIDGLAEGEEIVTKGTFSVDAAAQLEGKASMMNPSGGQSSIMHDHAAMMSQPVSSVKSVLRHETFKVEGNCEMCKERIETAAKSVTGVESANWEIDTKLIHITFNSSATSADSILKAIANAGHDNEKYRAPDIVYNKLPECCLYRK